MKKEVTVQVSQAGVRTQLLQGGHAVGLVVVLLDLGPAAVHMWAGHGAHGLPGQLHAADDGLKALVGKGRLLPVQFNDPGNPKDACSHSRGPLSQVPVRPEKSPGCTGLEGGLPHLLWVPPLGERRGQGRLRLHVTEREMKPRLLEQMPRVTEQLRAKAGAQFQVPCCRCGAPKDRD